MAVLGRVLIGSAERVDLADYLSIDSFAASDFRALVDSFIGSDTPYILRGFEVSQPNSAIGTQSISITIADSVVYYPASTAGPFFKGLEAGNAYAQPLVPELKKNATNYVYATFTTFDTASDSRAFWDPDKDGGAGGEFSQDVNTESVLTVEVGVSVSTFPEGVIPLCKVVVGAAVITSIQDCRNLMFRLGSGGAVPDPFNEFSFRSLPTADYARKESPNTMSTVLDPNCFQGGDKNIYTLKEWMDVVMTKLKELGGTTYWYEGLGTNAPNVVDLSWFTMSTVLKSKGDWQHNSSTAGRLTWTEDLKLFSLVDQRVTYVRAGTIDIPDNNIAYISFDNDTEFNITSTAVTWQNGYNAVNGVISTFESLRKGDWVKKLIDDDSLHLRVEEFYAGLNLTGGVTTPALAQSIKLSANYAGINETAIGVFTRGAYDTGDIVIAPRTTTSLTSLGSRFYWLASRNDTTLDITSIVTTTLELTFSEADGTKVRATVTNLPGHNLQDGDRIYVASGSYAGYHVVEVENTTQFFIQSSTVASEAAIDAYYAVVTVTDVYTADGFLLDSANHCFQTGNKVIIAGTTNHNGSFTVSRRSDTTFQIPIDAAYADPATGTAAVARLTVRTETGPIELLQGTSGTIGEPETQNILQYLGMPSLTVSTPEYQLPTDYNALDGYQNFNCSWDDDITARVSKLTAMMADRVQDRDIRLIGRVNIWNKTDGANQEFTSSGNLTLIKPSSAAQIIDLSGTLALPQNSAIVYTLDRDGAANITPAIVSLNTSLLLEENKFILAFRLTTGSIYLWNGVELAANGHYNTNNAEDSQNRNIALLNFGNADFDSSTDLITLRKLQRAEVSRITAVAGSSITQSGYFTLWSASDATGYYVWFNVDAGGVDPAVGGSTGIEVAISSGDSAATVAAAIVTAMNAYDDFVAVQANNDVVVTNHANGPATDIAHGATNSGVTLAVDIQGASLDIDFSIPGSSAINTIDVDAINTLGTLIVPDGSCAWVRIDRETSKTFNVIETTDVADSTAAGAIYITTVDAVPWDQDVFVLFRHENHIVTQAHSEDFLEYRRSDTFEPFQLTANNSRVVDIGAGQVESDRTNSHRLVPAFNDVTTLFPGGTITLPVSGTGTITVSSGSGLAVTVAANRFAKLAVFVDVSGDILLAIGTESATLNGASLPPPIAGCWAVGYIVVSTDGSANFNNVAEGDIFRYDHVEKVGDTIRFNMITDQTTNYTVTSTDGLVPVDSTGGAVTVTLPLASSVGRGHSIIISDIGGSASISGKEVTVVRSGSDTIVGETSFVFVGDYEARWFVSDGVNKWIIV